MAAIRLITAIPVVIIAIAWAFGAVWYDAPFGAGNRIAAALLATVFVVALIFVTPLWRKLVIFVVLFAGVLAWWLTLSPTNDSDWQPDVAREAWADIQGDDVTFHNVRNCDYRTETDYTPRWETRTGTPFADHWHRPRDQLLGLALDRTSDRQLPIRGRTAAVFLDRDSQEAWSNLLDHRRTLPAVRTHLYRSR